MAQLRRKIDGHLFTVASVPVWEAGMWNCGDQRFIDEQQTIYEAVVPYPLLTPMQFYLAFSVSERSAIKNSTDAIVKEFWATYQLAASQPSEQIDPNSTAILGGLAYIAGATSAPQPVIAAPILASAARIAQIQAGTPGGF